MMSVYCARRFPLQSAGTHKWGQETNVSLEQKTHPVRALDMLSPLFQPSPVVSAASSQRPRVPTARLPRGRPVRMGTADGANPVEVAKPVEAALGASGFGEVQLRAMERVGSLPVKGRYVKGRNLQERRAIYGGHRGVVVFTGHLGFPRAEVCFCTFFFWPSLKSGRVMG